MKKWGNKDTLKAADTEFYGSQLVFAKDAEMEARDMYAKPGTAPAKRQSDPWALSRPTSRYRSRNP